MTRRNTEDNGDFISWESIVEIANLLRLDSGFLEPYVTTQDVDLLTDDGVLTTAIEFKIINHTVKHNSMEFAKSITRIREQYKPDYIIVN